MAKLPVRDFLKAAKKVVPSKEYTSLVRQTEGETHVELPEFKTFPTPGITLLDGDRKLVVQFFTFKKSHSGPYVPMVGLSERGLPSFLTDWRNVQNLRHTETKNGQA